MTPEGIALIKKYEGFRGTAYVCPGGKWTIGYGFTGGVKQGDIMSLGEAERKLRTILPYYEEPIRSALPNGSAQQYAAMTSLAYNMGVAGFKKTQVFALHAAGRYAEAAQAFALINKPRGSKTPLAGLVARRAAEAALYAGGIDEASHTANLVPAPEKPLTSSRTMIGSSITAAGMGASQAVNEIEWLKETLLPLMPYLPQVFLVLALVGVGVAIYARWSDRKEGRS